MRRNPLCLSCLACLFAAFLAVLAGCGHPSRANIELRQRVQKLDSEVAALKTQHNADRWTIAGLEKRNPTVATLAPAALSRLWVTHGVQFNRMTGGIHLDPRLPGDQGLRLYVSPIDENAMPIQAAGSFVVEAFDLAEKGDNRIGRWTWDTVAAKSEWREFLIEYTYALTCPWQKIPQHRDITVRVIFTDELTQVPYSADMTVRVNLPPPGSSAPQTGPAPAH